jgi:hypothetical protein
MSSHRPVYVISQDGQGIWITAATFTQNYLDYMAHIASSEGSGRIAAAVAAALREARVGFSRD